MARGVDWFHTGIQFGFDELRKKCVSCVTEDILLVCHVAALCGYFGGFGCCKLCRQIPEQINDRRQSFYHKNRIFNKITMNYARRVKQLNRNVGTSAQRRSDALVRLRIKTIPGRLYSLLVQATLNGESASTSAA